MLEYEKIFLEYILEIQMLEYFLRMINIRIFLRKTKY